MVKTPCLQSQVQPTEAVVHQLLLSQIGAEKELRGREGFIIGDVTEITVASKKAQINIGVPPVKSEGARAKKILIFIAGFGLGIAVGTNSPELAAKAVKFLTGIWS